MGLPHPLIPADAGIQTLPSCMDFQWGKVWVPASAGTNGWQLGSRNSRQRLFAPATSVMPTCGLASEQ